MDRYFLDSRVIAGNSASWYEDFDPRTMTASVALWSDVGDDYHAEVPCHYEVCDLCSGSGSTVNPSIDCNGISSQEFADDPEFAEEYFSGAYDITCPSCKGNRVAPAITAGSVRDEVLDLIREQQNSQSEWDRESAMERAMGA